MVPTSVAERDRSLGVTDGGVGGGGGGGGSEGEGEGEG